MVKKRVFSQDSAKGDFKKYFFWSFVAVLVVLSYVILKSYLIALISAFVLAYLVRPLHKRLKGKIGDSFAAIVSILLILVILIVPIVLVIEGVVQQAYYYLSAGGVSDLFVRISEVISAGGMDIAGNLGDKAISFLAGLLSSTIKSIPSMLISLFITLLGIYYILIEWDSLARKLKEYIPFENTEKISKEVSKVTNVLVYGTLFIGLIEFVVAGLGFYLSGIEFYLLLSALIFFFAFIPGLGPAIVWIPLAVYQFFGGDYVSAVGVLITGLVLSVGIDVLLRGKVLGNRTKLNPLLMIVGIFGGVGFFGVFGFIIGPLVLIYTIELLDEGLKK